MCYDWKHWLKEPFSSQFHKADPRFKFTYKDNRYDKSKSPQWYRVNFVCVIYRVLKVMEV